MRVQAGAGRRAANAQPPQPLRREARLLAPALDRRRPGAHFLPQPNRHRVLQVRPTGLHHIVPFGRLASGHLDEARKRRQQLIQPPQDAQPNRGGDCVIGRLRHIDVIIGMDGLFAGFNVIAEDLIGAIRHHLVGVHVMAGARARLKGIDHKMLMMLSSQDFVARLNDGFREFGVEQAQVPVHFGRRPFDERDAPDEGGQRLHAGDREILPRALRLRRVERPQRHANLAQRIHLDPILGHTGHLPSGGAAIRRAGRIKKSAIIVAPFELLENDYPRIRHHTPLP